MPFNSSFSRMSDPTDHVENVEDEYDGHQSWLTSMVFENDFILKQIVKYVIFDAHGDLKRNQLASLRLVNTDFYYTVNNILWQEIRSFNKTPIFLPHLTYSEDRALFWLVTNQAHVETKVHNFIRCMEHSLFLDDPPVMPSINLVVVSLDAFNQPVMVQLLSKMCDGIVNLQLHQSFQDFLVMDDPTHPRLNNHPEWPAMNFSRLATLKFCHLPAALPQLREILSSAPNVRSVTLLGTGGVWGLETQPIVFPESMEYLKLQFEQSTMSGFMLERFLHGNRFSKIKFLEITMSLSNPFVGDGMKRILEPMSGSLEELHLGGRRLWIIDLDGAGNALEFPQSMPQLKTILVSSCWDLGERNSLSGSGFPKLEKVCLQHTASQINRWTSVETSSRMSSVKTVLLEVSNGDQAAEQVPLGNFMQHSLSVSRDQVRAMQHKFPNLVELELITFGGDLEGLRCIFGEMEKLSKLHIRGTYSSEFEFLGLGVRQLEDPLHWDSLILGVTPEGIEEFKRQLETGVELDQLDVRRDFPSINNLKNLKSLSLSMSYGGVRRNMMRLVFNVREENGALVIDFQNNRQEAGGNNPPVEGQQDDPFIVEEEEDPQNEQKYISDLSFQLGFLKMENLQELAVRMTHWNVSDDILEEWKQMKGTNVGIFNRSPYDHNFSQMI